MSFLPRRVGMLALLALLIAPMLLLAQEDVTISVAGSGIVTPILEEVANNSGATLNVTVTGTNDGFARFCRGESDLVATTRAIGGDEDSNCLRSGVTYFELVIGHNIAAVITHPENTTVQCLTTAELNSMFAPSSQASSWAQINIAYADIPLSLNIPTLDTAAYALLDSVIEGDGFRGDAAESSAAGIVSAVSSTPGAVGVVPLPAALAGGVRILEVNAGDAGCAAPSAETVESRLYTVGQRLFVYVNANDVEQPGLTDFLTALTGDTVGAAVEAAGFTPATAAAYENDRTVIAEGRRGREFSADVTGFNILPNVSGTVTTGGSVSGATYLSALTTAFSTEYPGVTATNTFEGEQAGIRRLCNGELDLIAATGELTQEQQDNCAANNITLTTIDLGKQAVVLVANAGSPYLACLSTTEIGTAFNATSTGTISTWNQVRADFPANAMTLFAPSTVDNFSDLLMHATFGINGINREDIQLNDDPFYRAAAVGNVEGALTFMSWADYQSVLENNQANIQLVGVGENCVQPSEAAIADGTYPITRSLRLLISDVALARPEVQSVVWYAASDAQYGLLSAEGLLGLDFAELADLRQSLQQTFLDAQLAAAERAANPEVTPEITAQPAPGEEPTAEATPPVSESTAPEATPGS